MIRLAPEKLDFVISTTHLRAAYDETAVAVINVDVQTIADYDAQCYREVDIHFECVAEIRCVTLNFFEVNHEGYSVLGLGDQPLQTWRETGVHPDPCFYQIMDSALLYERKALYDPSGTLGLKHYLLVGYDSHVEVIAKGYRCQPC